MLVSEDGKSLVALEPWDKLGFGPGEIVDVTVKRGGVRHRVGLAPVRGTKHELVIITDPDTGWPALSAGPDAPVMTSEHVVALDARIPGAFVIPQG